MWSKPALLWSTLLALLLSPVLVCIVAWGLAARPGAPRSVVTPLLPGRRLEVDVRPCEAVHPGRLAIWYIDSSSANRFIRERFVLLLRVVAAPPCP
jgi:hypothetical protein